MAQTWAKYTASWIIGLPQDLQRKRITYRPATAPKGKHFLITKKTFLRIKIGKASFKNNFSLYDFPTIRLIKYPSKLITQ